ncbi:hypothetical protein DICPUDRAFT_46012 [Dictyostelium purpureum]|uniref:Nudix hydrolase domain-containing protein n=1 Tax=Dictyostelium purpureum TaxID=5786 RepID=F0ZD34_DICPU|nr:uncharacterized protein DICPUDRAFT_46012 [Dictyostelium purpureum]EGC38112.1 hypothetical protein DICPUDRAFT_46012 [Dictyostelium purpureum]|eukprot:XP_003285326.1 hypothetical protein DICPUDRAFT_46012 [Dictyostelium purpureum]
MVEYIDVCDEKGNQLGYSLPRAEIHQKGLYHRVVHVWIVDSNGMVLIQKRTASKDSYPSMWDKSCAGHIEAGMGSKETAVKELSEELGLLFSENRLELLFSTLQCNILNEGKFIDNEISDVYLITLGKPFDLQKLKLQVEEVSEAKLVNHQNLYEMIKNQDPTFTPLYDSHKYPNFNDAPYFKFFQILTERFPISDKITVNS